MTEEKEKLDHLINFRSTEKMYEDLINYLKHTGETISGFMRQATYDYLKLKEAIKKNGYGNEPEKEKEQEEITVDLLDQIEANKFCDGDSCEIDYEAEFKKNKAVDQHD